MHSIARSRAVAALGTMSLVVGLVAAVLIVLAAPALAAGTEHCPGANDGSSLPSDYAIVLDNDVTAGYSQDDRNGTVPTAGTHVCVKGSTDATGIVTADGVRTLEQILGNQHDVSYYMTYTRASVALGTGCVGTQPTATVTIDDNGVSGFQVEVFLGDVSQGTITQTTSYDGVTGSDLRAEWGDGETVAVTFQDCSTPGEPAPIVTLSRACVGTQPTATVTIDDDGDEDFSVEVFIDGVPQGAITATQTFEAKAESVLRAVWGDDESDITFQTCTEDEPLLSSASFTTGTECDTDLPAVTYDATVSETADDPVGDITLTVTDANGVERARTTFSESAAGSLKLPTAFEGATVAVGWDFDGTTTQQTLASGCSDVRGVVEQPDPPATPGTDTDTDTDTDAAPLPVTDVKGEQVANEQLPNAGAEHVVLVLLAGAFLALGGAMLLLADPRQGIVS